MLKILFLHTVGNISQTCAYVCQCTQPVNGQASCYTLLAATRAVVCSLGLPSLALCAVVLLFFSLITTVAANANRSLCHVLTTADGNAAAQCSGVRTSVEEEGALR